MLDPYLNLAALQINRLRDRAELNPAIQSFFDDATNTASYVVHDAAPRRAAIIDSVLDYDPAAGRTSTTSADRIIEFITRHRLVVDWLLETHAHADHLSAAPYLQQHLGGKLAIGREIIRVQRVFGKLFNAGTNFARDGSEFDRLFEDGDQFSIGNIPAIALHVPGHTPADMAYVIGDAVFTGDTLFMPDYGTARADFPGGGARPLYGSVCPPLSLPRETPLFPRPFCTAPARHPYAWGRSVWG